MTPERRKQLEDAGHTVTTAEDFFGLDDFDRKVVAFRLALAREVRRLRAEQGLTKYQLAVRIEVSQSRSTGIEKGEKASLEAIATADVALGGDLPDSTLGDFTHESRTSRRVVKRQPKRLAPLLRPKGMAVSKRGKGGQPSTPPRSG